MVVQQSWADASAPLGQFVAEQTQSMLDAYQANPDLVREHSNIEAAISQGGYGRKQLNELIQNAADAIKTPGGRISVVLTHDALYCANEGQPLTDEGVKTLMLSHSSAKRDNEIGKFGLGFKSVIQITDTPSIFSRSCSISWSQERNRKILETIFSGLDIYPTLRIANPVDPYRASDEDLVLGELMAWASTVVKLPLSSRLKWLSEEMAAFPKEFLLFSRNVAKLELDDRVENRAVSWTAQRDDQKVVISNGLSNSEWVVFEHEHPVTTMAAAEAGSLAARPTVTVTWAVPMSSAEQKRQRLGRFWNYFPTKHRTSLSGIVNAAFKMNEDRYSMLETLYNEEILKTALPIMVAGALEHLSPTTDPGLFLDILPSRPKEFESWADRVINEPIFAILPTVPSLPDRSGKLQFPQDIKVQPTLEDADRLTKLWESWIPKERPWLHSSALNSRDREPQVVRILKSANLKRTSLEEWLEEVVKGGELQDYENALQLAAMIDKSYSAYQAEMRRSRIILMADGSIQPALVSRVFLPLDPNDESDNVVSYDLMQQGQAISYLRALDLQAQDGRGTVSRVAAAAAQDYADATLAESLWKLTRTLPLVESLTIVRERTEPLQLLVRCRDSKWRPLGDVWLPGELMSASSVGDEHLLIDAQRHNHDLALLRNLGARTALSEPVMTSSGRTFDEWKTAQAQRISLSSKSGPAPISPAGIRFSPTLVTDGLHLLVDASPTTRAKVTNLLLDRPQYAADVRFTSTYRSAEKINGPDIWWVNNYGVLQTPIGLVDVKNCVSSIEGIPTGFLPYPGDAVAATLNLPTDATKVKWQMVLAEAEKVLSVSDVHQLYGALAKLGIKPPKELLVYLGKDRTTRELIEHAILAADAESRDYLVDIADQAVLYTGEPELDSSLMDKWGIPMQKVDFFTEVEFSATESDAEDLTIAQHYPFLKRAASEVSVSTRCVPCSSVSEVRTNTFDSRRNQTSRSFILSDGTLYYRAPQGEQALLTTILAAFGSKRATSTVMQTMRQLKKDKDIQGKIDAAGNHPTDAGKIAELVGRQTLRNLIPDAVVRMLEARGLELTDERLFEVVSNLHGQGLLKVLKPALEEAGILVPTQFTGGRTAQEFVKELGFSPAMAGRTTKKKPAREEVVGPVGLNPLHDYQESTSQKIGKLLAGSTEHSRGLVQLPTGAGKTRVAVESVIRDVKTAPKDKRRLVIWIAQSHELCEQAIDTWTYVWQAAGVPGERMAISRLWGGNTAIEEKTKLHVVVATIDTLASIHKTRRQMYDWMSNPDLVIIDEAHGAIAASYTSVLRWFGRSFQHKSRSLLGLSATPFRGTNEEATARLVKRFSGNLIEPDEFTADNAHDYLQGMGVLAKVKHQELAGITLRLMPAGSNGDEEAPKHDILEERIDLQQVADSMERNHAILSAIKTSETQGPALVFAASVQHAEALAAVLTVEGIPAAAISGKTDPGHRRTIIEDFRSGKIRVLTNFDVLTQGFDAPKVDAVYVCRPTFSPNKYIQMIGRGLRGPLNGGSEEVLIVNIKDNLEQHGHKLAFTQLDYLWKAGA